MDTKINKEVIKSLRSMSDLLYKGLVKPLKYDAESVDQSLFEVSDKLGLDLEDPSDVDSSDMNLLISIAIHEVSTFLNLYLTGIPSENLLSQLQTIYNVINRIDEIKVSEDSKDTEDYIQYLLQGF